MQGGRGQGKMAQIVIDPFEPSDMAWVVSQHQRLYTQAEGFDDTFGPLVQEIIQAFAQHHDPAREAGWIARQAGQRVGWTHESHLAACALYARTGWTLTDSKPVRSFGRDLVEQTWRIRL